MHVHAISKVDKGQRSTIKKMAEESVGDEDICEHVRYLIRHHNNFIKVHTKVE